LDIQNIFVYSDVTIHWDPFVWRQAVQRSQLFHTLLSRGPRVQFNVLQLMLRFVLTVF